MNRVVSLLLEEVLKSVGASCCPDDLIFGWDESVATAPSGAPSFLEPEEFRINHAWSGLDATALPAIEDVARRVRERSALTLLAWHAYRWMYVMPEAKGFDKWPSLERALGDDWGCFYLLIALAMVPKVRAIHGTLHIPESVTRTTCLQIAGFAQNFAQACGGRLGLLAEQLPWLRHHAAGELFRIGRMEFMARPFQRCVRVYRHRESGCALALAQDGVCYDAEGYVVSGDAGGWTATLRTDAGTVAGYPISPYGTALRREVVLRLADWECVTPPDEFTLDMHIPPGGNMTPERCIESLRSAAAFFGQYFPDKPCRTVSSSSWIFGPQLETIFPDTANLVRLLREVYLFPVPMSADGGLSFIFHRNQVMLETAPRETTLQRKVAEYLEAGKPWHVGGMVFLVEDLDHFGTQHYRGQWPAVQQLVGLT